MTEDLPRAADPSAELVEVVDETGAVIDVVTREEIRAGNLRHRCTYVAVVSSDDRLVVHQRASWKDVYPDYWDICFGGVTGVNEEWVDAAMRELAEEAGITGVDPAELGVIAYDEDDGRIVGRAYVVRYDGPITCEDGEVVAIDHVPADDLDQWLVDRDICPDSELLVLPLVRRFLIDGR